MGTDTAVIKQFHAAVYGYYRTHGRHGLPWRQPEADGSFDPYKILVSEIMLQQTQVNRVILKYHQFLDRFPTIQTLAAAEQGDVLRAWSGLGYNRRAKYLHLAAKEIVAQGTFPETNTKLVKLPGVGKNTAGAVLAYAFNRPALFIETNIRTVYIHHFFGDKTDITDAEILNLLEQTIDTASPRQFYWALMDYGTYLKSTIGNLNMLSKHFTRQSTFHGSKRQVRGQVLRLLATHPLSLEGMKAEIKDLRLPEVVDELVAEQLVRVDSGIYSL